VCIDLSPSFISGCEKYMPDAEIVFDVFHLNQFVLKAMDEVRKIEARGDKILFNKTRYLRLYNKERLTEDKTKQLEYIMNKNS
jgi:transposase